MEERTLAQVGGQPTPPSVGKLVRVDVEGPLRFYGAILQELSTAQHPYLVLRSGHLIVAETSLLYMRAVRDTWSGVVYGGGAMRVITDPEQVTVYHSTSFRPSRHIASGNKAVAKFIMDIYGKMLVTGKDKTSPDHLRWVLLDAPPQTPEGLERDLDQKGVSVETLRDCINQAIDSVMGLLP